MAVSQVQQLLRFLSQDAKVPLATAMGKVNELVRADLTTSEQISKTELKSLQEIFKDDKIAKQVLNAAKRISKKRRAPTENTGISPQKKSRTQAQETTPFAAECALALPVSTATEEELSRVALLTNRAPLLLAFAVCVLKYTMPEQPVSSRLSLAQAVVSANSRSKAVGLGIESGQTAEQEGWGEGQATCSALGREIKVLKRWDYNTREGKPAHESSTAEDNLDDMLGQYLPDNSEPAPPLWGIDTEAIRRAHHSDTGVKAETAFPIHTSQSARSYLLKAFVNISSGDAGKPEPPKKRTQAQIEAERESCLGHLLRSIDLVCQSWAYHLTKDELDRRAWAWYMRVRPSIRSGAEGWGEKGVVKLSEILALKRQP
ncbi:hypothetical protein BJX99DRAFT_264816 [Aspergillus californicus]